MSFRPIGAEEPDDRHTMNQRFQDMEHDAVLKTEKGQPGGVVPLGTDGKIAEQYMPARCVVSAGSYSGNGQYSQHIDVGFPVAAVLIENSGGSRNETWNAATVGGLAVKGCALEHGGVLAAVSGNGFDVYTRGQYQGDFNGTGRFYYYVAWGMVPIS